MSRADEVIERLQAEIVKRDARVAELEEELELSNECLDMANENYAALKEQQRGAVDELATFEEWASRKYPNASRRDALGAFSRDLKKSAKEGWQARSALVGCKEAGVMADELNFEAAYSKAVENGWDSVKDLARQIWSEARALLAQQGKAVGDE